MKCIYISILILLMIDAQHSRIFQVQLQIQRENPVTFANIYFEGSYDGTISDAEGNFTLTKRT